MIKAIDEMMIRWAEELHGPDSKRMGGGSGSTLARLIDCKGVLISRTDRVGDPTSVSTDIELIVNKHLPIKLARLAQVHYLDHDSPNSMKWERCGCGRSQYYQRLSLLHAAVAELLVRRKRAA